jgi:hypothetical protein
MDEIFVPFLDDHREDMERSKPGYLELAERREWQNFVPGNMDEVESLFDTNFKYAFIQYVGGKYVKNEMALNSYLQIRMVCDNLGSLEIYNAEFLFAKSRILLKDHENLAIHLYINGLSVELQKIVRDSIIADGCSISSSAHLAV